MLLLGVFIQLYSSVHLTSRLRCVCVRVFRLAGTYETREVQVEYFVPLEKAEAALQICSDVCGKWSYDVFLITELRAIRADEMW